MPAPQPPIDDDDDDELELEPIDPEILAHERQRAEEKVEAVTSSIDVDELYRESDYSDLDVDWTSWKQFRFTTRHLLILTAILALVLTLRILLGGCNTIFILGVVLVAAGWMYVLYVERQQEALRERRRREFFANVGKPAAAPTDPLAEAAAPEESPPAEAGPRFQVKMAFSLKQLFITMTVAAVMMALIASIGPDRMAIVLGLIALAGLVVQAAGVEAPAVVVLGWWLLLAMYLVVGLIAALRPEDDKASRTPPVPRPAAAATA